MKTTAFLGLALAALAFCIAGEGSHCLFGDTPGLGAARLEAPWVPAGQLPRAVSQALDDPQWADLKKASATASGQAACSRLPARFVAQFIV